MEKRKEEGEVRAGCQAFPGCREAGKPWCSRKGPESEKEGKGDPEGFRRACPVLAMQIIDTGEPKGLFWGFFGGLFIAIDSTQTEIFCEDFLDREECLKWLRCERCVDARGYVHFDY